MTDTTQVPDMKSIVLDFQPDNWTVGDVIDFTDIAGIPFDELLKIVELRDFRRITPGMLAGLMLIAGRHSHGDSYTLGDVRATNLMDALTAFSGRSL